MPDRGDPRTLRTATTLILAVFGPATLLSGLVTLVTIPTGTPSFLVGLTVFCLVVCRSIAVAVSPSHRRSWVGRTTKAHQWMRQGGGRRQGRRGPVRPHCQLRGTPRVVTAVALGAYLVDDIQHRHRD